MSAAADFLAHTLIPGLAWTASVIGSKPFDTTAARVVMLAIAGQESNWTEREQKPVAHAKSFWQFEQGGGVKGVLNHPATKAWATQLAAAARVPPTAEAVWSLFATPEGDNLAVAFARLLLWTDPHALPPVGDTEGAWVCYTGLWRPGKPSHDRWHIVYPQALAAVKS